MSLTDEIHQKLATAFGAGSFEVEDDSEAHRGHGGYREGGESHFNVAVTSPDFATMTRVQRHRAVHGALGQVVLERIHALSLDLRAPAEEK